MSSRPAATAALLLAAVLLGQVPAARACPGDALPRAPGVLLVVQGAGPAPLALDAVALAALPAAVLTQRLTVSADAGGGSTERSIAYGGIRLRELLLQAGLGGPADRAARFTTIEAVADDGYRALFSWGELFNSPVGDQVLVIATQDGRPLDEAAGPLALRALGDLRPGPRHVRNLCAVVVRR